MLEALLINGIFYGAEEFKVSRVIELSNCFGSRALCDHAKVITASMSLGVLGTTRAKGFLKQSVVSSRRRGKLKDHDSKRGASSAKILACREHTPIRA
jgi:hypothetical protein